MARLHYATLASLDGYVADETGRFDWAVPDAEVHRYINDLERSIGTNLYGRRMYETMLAWETMPADTGQPPEIRDYAEIWRAAEKIVFSRTLDTASSARTRIEREFDPEAVRRFKTSADRDLSIAGAELAAQAIAAGLVDEYHLFLAPVVVGAGKRALPDGARVELELLDQRRFANGMAYLRYGVRGRSGRG